MILPMLTKLRRSRLEQLLWNEVNGIRGYLLAGLGALFASILAYLIHEQLPHANLSLVFLTTVLVIAAKTGLSPAIFSAILGFFSFNFFFTPPFHTLTVDEQSDMATLFFFIIMATLTANLGARMRSHVANTREAHARNEQLLEFSRTMAAAATDEQIISALLNNLHGLSQTTLVLVLFDDKKNWRYYVGKHAPSNEETITLTDWLEKGATSMALPSDWSSLPLYTRHGNLGHLLWRHVGDGVKESAFRHLASSLCNQAVVALERTCLVDDLEHAKIESETERLRSALLSSVSHDLRTPLASIIGSTDSLLHYGDSFSIEDRRILLQTINNEAERLNRYIQNLLDMTRLGHGTITLKRDWIELHDVLASAIQRLKGNEHHFDIHLPEDLPLLYVHGTLLEQALVNIIDNSIRFSPAGKSVLIDAGVESHTLTIRICDEGPGIAPEERDKVFDMFYSVSRGDGQNDGTGLGLAISQGMIGAHGGDIEIAENADKGKGTCMIIHLPVTDKMEPTEH